MTFRHHPGDETLLRYAAGTLAPGARVVVAVHVAMVALVPRTLPSMVTGRVAAPSTSVETH